MLPRHDLLNYRHIPGYLEKRADRLFACTMLDPEYPEALRNVCRGAISLHDDEMLSISERLGAAEEMAEASERAQNELDSIRQELESISLHSKFPSSLDLDSDIATESVRLLGEAERQRIKVQTAVDLFFEELCMHEDSIGADIWRVLRDAVVASKLHRCAGTSDVDGITVPSSLGGKEK